MKDFFFQGVRLIKEITIQATLVLIYVVILIPIALIFKLSGVYVIPKKFDHKMVSYKIIRFKSKRD